MENACIKNERKNEIGDTLTMKEQEGKKMKKKREVSRNAEDKLTFVAPNIKLSFPDPVTR